MSMVHSPLTPEIGSRVRELGRSPTPESIDKEESRRGKKDEEEEEEDEEEEAKLVIP